MSNQLILKRGLSTNRSNVVPAQGELIFTTDTNKVFVGDGSTAGGLEVGGGSSGATSLDGLSDVAVGVTPLSDGDMLRFNGTASEWQNVNLGAITAAADLSPITVDVNVGGVATTSIINLSTYAQPSFHFEVQDLQGVVQAASTASIDLVGDTIFVNDCPTEGTFKIVVYVQDFGSIKSAASSVSYTVVQWQNTVSGRFYRITNDGYTGNMYIIDVGLYDAMSKSGTKYPTSAMTANNAPSPFVVVGTNSYNATYDGYKAFDSSTSSGYWNLSSSDPGNDYLQIDLGVDVVVKSITMLFNNSFHPTTVSVATSSTGAFAGEETVILANAIIASSTLTV